MAGVTNIGAQDLEILIKTTPEMVEIIDVREKDEYEQMHVKGSKLIPLGTFGKNMDKVDWAKDVIFICQSGGRSSMAANFAASAGKNVKNVEGGIMGVQRWGLKDLLERS